MVGFLGLLTYIGCTSSVKSTCLFPHILESRHFGLARWVYLTWCENRLGKGITYTCCFFDFGGQKGVMKVWFRSCDLAAGKAVTSIQRGNPCLHISRHNKQMICKSKYIHSDDDDAFQLFVFFWIREKEYVRVYVVCRVYTTPTFVDRLCNTFNLPPWKVSVFLLHSTSATVSEKVALNVPIECWGKKHDCYFSQGTVIGKCFVKCRWALTLTVVGHDPVP